MKTIGPSFVALQVSDLETSAGFYTEELGLDPRHRAHPGRSCLPRHLSRSPSVSPQWTSRKSSTWAGASRSGSRRTTPAHFTTSCPEAGVAIVTPPFEGPFGLTFAFEDPDGYVITIHG